MKEQAGYATTVVLNERIDIGGGYVVTSFREGYDKIRAIRPDGFGGYVVAYASGVRMRIPLHAVAHAYEHPWPMIRARKAAARAFKAREAEEVRQERKRRRAERMKERRFRASERGKKLAKAQAQRRIAERMAVRRREMAR